MKVSDLKPHDVVRLPGQDRLVAVKDVSEWADGAGCRVTYHDGAGHAFLVVQSPTDRVEHIANLSDWPIGSEPSADSRAPGPTRWEIGPGALLMRGIYWSASAAELVTGAEDDGERGNSARSAPAG